MPNGTFSGQPVIDGDLDFQVVATMCDGTKQVYTLQGVVKIESANSPPVFDEDLPASHTIQVGTPFTYQVQASDADGDSIFYTGSNLPPGLSININTGLISGTPTSAGSYSYTICITDSINPAVCQTAICIVEDNTCDTCASVNGTTVADGGSYTATGNNVVLNFSCSTCAGTYQHSITWGDGSPIEVTTSTSASHLYPSTASTYTINVSSECIP